MYSISKSIINLYYIQPMSCSKLGSTKLRVLVLVVLKHEEGTTWRAPKITALIDVLRSQGIAAKKLPQFLTVG
jgi:hypothetical protein